MFGRTKRIKVKVNDKPGGTFQILRLRSALFDSHHYSFTKRVSFCTIINPFDEFLIKTLPENLSANHIDQAHVEFVVLIPQGWKSISDVKIRFSKELKSSYLKIAIYDPNIKVGILRNVCYQLAQGMILSNLESSDYTGLRAANFIYKELTSVRHDSVLWFRQKGRVSSRIALWRDSFYEIGGFDEREKYTTQCSNLIHRLNLYGVETNFTSNKHFTKSIVKSKWNFFSWQTERKVKKLSMTPLDQLEYDLL